MTHTDHVMTLTLALPGEKPAVEEMLEHFIVRRYLDAGWTLRAHGTVAKGRAATVPLVAPEGWPECMRGDF